MKQKQKSTKSPVQRAISLLYLIAGVACATLGLRGFLIPTHLIDGGVTGISMLCAATSGLNMSVWLVAINLPFIVLGYMQVGKSFGLKCGLAIIALALAVSLVHIPTFTHDRLLSAVFGGVFLGAGIGLSIRGGGVLDGTEIFALLTGRKLGATVGSIILVINIVIFTAAAFILSIESALYSMLTYFAASKTVDFLLYGLEAYNGMMIFSQKSDKIREALISDLGRGVTIFKGRGGFSAADQDILFCVLTRLEVLKAKAIVNEIDKTAFVVLQQINDVQGGIVKRTGHLISG